MIVIHVQKAWLATIGGSANLILVYNDAGEQVSLLASSVSISFPFVEAELARKDVSKVGSPFLSAKIPSGVVTGIFDHTEAEGKMLGFIPQGSQVVNAANG